MLAWKSNSHHNLPKYVHKTKNKTSVKAIFFHTYGLYESLYFFFSLRYSITAMYQNNTYPAIVNMHTLCLFGHA